MLRGVVRRVAEELDTSDDPDAPRHPGSFDVTLTFPGPVQAAEPPARISGNTVTWSDRSSADAGGLQVVAADQPIFPTAVWASGAGILGLALGASAATLLARRSRGPGNQAELAASETEELVPAEPDADDR